MVAAELRDDPYADATQILVVKNHGPSIARNLRISFEPEIPDPVDPSSSVTPFLKNRYSKPIAVLTPGMELDNIYFSGRPGREGKWVNAEPTPAQVTVKVRYESDDGEEFADHFPLDVGLIRDRTYVTSSRSPDSMMKEATLALKGIHEIAKKVESRTRGSEPD